MKRRASMVCYDDRTARDFQPFALTRPWSEMRVGALLVRERWEFASGARAGAFIAGSAMKDFRETGAPRSATGVVRAGTLVVNSRFAVSLVALDTEASVYRNHNRIAAVRLSRDEPLASFADGKLSLDTLARAHHPRVRGRAVEGQWCDDVWDAVRLLPGLVSEDIPHLAVALRCTSSDTLAEDSATRDSDTPFTVIGVHPLWIEGNAHVEPQTVFDTSAGPILLRAGSHVQAFTRMSGPCIVGQNSIVIGGRISCSSIGDNCKVCGEVCNTAFVGHANKSHDGFVGHSMLGRWVNLGAGTTTSNLKNTYGTVAMWTPEGIRNTGMQFLGTLFGDHVKSGIGLRLSTGCVIGAGANIVDRMPPKMVEPFAWGSSAPYSAYDGEKFLESAERMMARRGVTLDPTMRRHLRAVYTRRLNLG